MEAAHEAAIGTAPAPAAMTPATMPPESNFSTYEEARAEAQRRANETGFDIGVELNDVFKNFSVFMLPRRENRCGHELKCEVVMAEDLTKCQDGHGPTAPAAPVIISSPAEALAVFGETNPNVPPAPPAAPADATADALRAQLTTPDATFACPVKYLFVDTLPGKGWEGPQPANFNEYIHAIERAAASSSGALDVRLIKYESSGWIAVAIRLLMRGLPEAVYLDSRSPWANIIESVIAPYAKMVFRGTR